MQNKKIHIYIDESGDTGIKFDEGSSKLFVVSLLCVKNEILDKTENQLKKITNEQTNQNMLMFCNTNIMHKIKCTS